MTTKTRTLANQEAARALVQHLEALRFHRVLIVGGTPTIHAILAHLTTGRSLDLRCLDGTQAAPRTSQLRPWLHDADLVVIWASTPLAHKVS